MPVNELLIRAFDNQPLYEVNGKIFILNPLTEQVPATTSQLLDTAADEIIRLMDTTSYDKIITEEDKGAIIVAAVSLKTGLPFGMARWYPNQLADQVSEIFSCEYTSGKLYVCGIEKDDRICIIDDMISTGGTLIGLIKALEKLQAEIVDIIVIGDKIDYGGKKKVEEATGYKVKSLIQVSVAGSRSEVISTI